MLGDDMMPAMVSVKFLAARLRASEGVCVGIVIFVREKYEAANPCVTCVDDEYFVAAVMLP
jgi:hypothetical protein